MADCHTTITLEVEVLSFLDELSSLFICEACLAVVGVRSAARAACLSLVLM